jgi:hypothetical protein
MPLNRNWQHPPAIVGTSFRLRRVFFQRLAENSVPTFEGGQLLRSLARCAKKPAMRVRAARARPCSQWLEVMVTVVRPAWLVCRPIACSNRGATDDGFAMMSRISQTNEQIPPVEHQRDAAGHQAAALEVARREATRAPVVLQFVETVLAIGAIAIELTERQYLAVERCDENGIFKDLPGVGDLGKAEPQLTVAVTFAQRPFAFDAPPQDHDAAIPAPALKPPSLPCQCAPTFCQSCSPIARSTARLTPLVRSHPGSLKEHSRSGWRSDPNPHSVGGRTPQQRQRG